MNNNEESIKSIDILPDIVKLVNQFRLATTTATSNLIGLEF